MTLAIAVLAGFVSGCGAHHPPPPETPADTAPPPAAAGTTLEGPGYRVTVTGADALRVDTTTDPAPTVQGYLSGTSAGVNVRLAGGGQPSTPVTLSFDFRGKPAPAGPGQVPAVVAVSEGAPGPEVLSSHWDPDTQTLTAKTDHLSGFFPFALDLGKFATQMTNALNGYLGLSSAAPGCVGQPLAVGDTTYTLDPSTVPPAWPCLSRSGDNISVDLASNSPLGWIVHSQPTTGDQGPELAPDVGQAIDLLAYHTLFAPAVGDGTLLLPGGTTHLRFATANPPQQIGLRADPGVTLLNGLILALHAAYPAAKLFEIPGIVDCLKPFTTLSGDTDPSGTDIGARLQPMIDCVTSTAAVLPGKPANPLEWAASLAAKSLGAVLSLGPAVANQLAATVSGFVGCCASLSMTMMAPLGLAMIW